ncbi:hypothetical protein ARALYDRAFT_915131 [Arabidopsis lyrata subsp. lyrata]|uniref:HSF-type DNA-binding domain-containing protein n=2 Tax=Arabidopsis lyrata subsp. lyrata TaxID=81972 RepID=D7M9X3_ARALL|nr:hypothetical protein ARALYDRAFT_915131 [Arabidopsis lyrata subsp. lyrata]
MDPSSSIARKALDLLKKTYEVVDHPSTNSIISWGHDNKSFIIWDLEGFEKFLLPNILSPGNLGVYASYLKLYGFLKVESEQKWEFADDDFVRGHPELLEKITDRYKIYCQAFCAREGLII